MVSVRKDKKGNSVQVKNNNELLKSSSNRDEILAKQILEPEQINDSEIEIFNPDEMFSSESGMNNESMVVKELFNPKNPKIKSEFSDREIKILCRLYSLSKMYYEPRRTYILKETLDEFVLERMSKDRKSRQEFVEAHKEVKKDNTNGFFNNLLGKTQ